jgi:hypothetical protein
MYFSAYGSQHIVKDEGVLNVGAITLLPFYHRLQTPGAHLALCWVVKLVWTSEQKAVASENMSSNV